MKANLIDLTFLIPVRVDSIIRMENLLMVTRYLLKNFDTNIIVLEASDYDNGILRKLLDKRIDYLFIEDKDPVFYRTKYLNLMTDRAMSVFVGIWDADVIIAKDQIIDAVENLRNGFEIAFPYDGTFLDTSDVVREHFVKNGQIVALWRNKTKMGNIYPGVMGGGAILVNKEAYVLAGKENERYYGWGPEDFDRHERWKAFGYNIYRSRGCLFHLTHPRGSNSTFRSNDQVINTNRELFLTRGSSKEEILLALGKALTIEA